jgi:hypothetical protein
MLNIGGLKTWEIVAFGALCIAGLGAAAMILSAQEGEEDWTEFKEKHHCVSVAQARGGNGAGWQCDDGKTHYRWRQQK